MIYHDSYFCLGLPYLIYADIVCDRPVVNSTFAVPFGRRRAELQRGLEEVGESQGRASTPCARPARRDGTMAAMAQWYHQRRFMNNGGMIYNRMG